MGSKIMCSLWLRRLHFRLHFRLQIWPVAAKIKSFFYETNLSIKRKVYNKIER